MSILISSLPKELSYREAVEAVYGEDIEWIVHKLRVGLSVLVECDKQLAPYLYQLIKEKLERLGGYSSYLITGRSREKEGTLLAGMLSELAEMVRGGRRDVIVGLLHLDLLTSASSSNLHFEVREVIAWFYENPQLTLLGFKDPSFRLPRVVRNVFTVSCSIVGIRREKLPFILLQREARKLGVETCNPYRLYKYVSGLNAVRFRQVMRHFDRFLDFDPSNPQTREKLYQEIRSLTLSSTMEVPRVDLYEDIGGYREVKRKLEENILSLLRCKESLTDPEEIRHIESLIPRGIIFHGPPGTGKTYFAKALATSIDATLTVVSGPELKSKWVGESEENLRRIFAQARRSAPSIIVFDEIDSFASSRRAGSASGVEHSMLNQLLTEMDGFRQEELVFVVGTTNFPEALDPALLRPGRFEFLLEIPYPSEEDRREILSLYNQRYGLGLSEEWLEYMVFQTAGFVDLSKKIRYSGDHLAAICRSIKRRMVLEGRKRAEEADIQEAFSAYRSMPLQLDLRRVAVHEAGHGFLAAILPLAKEVERISIEAQIGNILGYTQERSRENVGQETRGELQTDIYVALAGRAAEAVLLGDISIGSWTDLREATVLARLMVESFGMSERIGPRFIGEGVEVSSELMAEVDREVGRILQKSLEKVEAFFRKYREVLESFVEELLKKRRLERKEILSFLGLFSIDSEDLELFTVCE